MTSSQTDRLQSANSSKAIKAPVRSVCTTNITASGLSAITTIDGSLTPVANDRFLLAGQTSSVDNGIYVASSGAWTRSTDFDANRDVAKGTLIVTQTGLLYRLTSADPITIGTTALTFSSNDASTIVASLASTAIGAGAALVGVNDAGGTITATTVEGALQEITAASWVVASRIGSGAVTPVKLSTSALANGALINGYLDASVSGNAMTVSLKTMAGTDPSATDPLYVVFRNATASTGSYSVMTLTAATSLAVSAGSTLGTTSAVAERIYVGLFNDGGTGRLFVYNPHQTVTSYISLQGLYDGCLYSATTEGGAGGADAAHTLYASQVVTSKPIALIGYIETTQATAGTWATAPSKIHTLRLGDKRTGDIVKTQRGVGTDTFSTGTTSIPFDATTPLSTEGDVVLQDTVVATNAANMLRIEAQTFLSSTAAIGTVMTAALFTSTGAAAAAASVTNVAANTPMRIELLHLMRAGSTASQIFNLQAGSASTATTTFNGANGANIFATTPRSYLGITEIFT